MYDYHYNGVRYGIDSCMPYNIQMENKLNDLKSNFEEELKQAKKDFSASPSAEQGGTFSDPDNAYSFEGDINGELNVSGKAVIMDNMTFNSGDGSKQRRLIVEGRESVEMHDVKLVGPFKSDVQKNATVMINGSDKVLIDGLTFEANGDTKAAKTEKTYNLIEIGLNKDKELPSEVTIRNCKFNGELTNNGILIFGMKENGVINIENCYFEKISNPLRYSNNTNVSNVTINITDCECKEWEGTAEYAGFTCLQDYINNDEAIDPMVFGPDKVTFNVKNSYGPGHKNLNSYDTPMNSLFYAYKDNGKNKGIIPFSEEFYPKVNFLD